MFPLRMLIPPLSKAVTNFSRATLALALLGAGLVLASTAAPAKASNWGSTWCDPWGGYYMNCVSLANNKYHAIRWRGTVNNQWPGLTDATTWALANVYNPTDMVAYVDNSDPYPDVWVGDKNWGYSVGAYGWAQCYGDTVTATSGSDPYRTCRGQRIRINGTYSDLYNSNSKRRWLMCHELGHTVGLRHKSSSSSSSCMSSNGYPQTKTSLTSHDKSHINSYY